LTHKGIFDALNIATEDTPTSFIYSEGGTLVYSASFTTWLMCEPKDLPGDWVPLKQITWSVFVSAKWPTGSESPIIGANSKVFVVGGAPGEATRVGSAALYTPYAFSDSIVFPVWFTICNTAVGPKK
jgi:hypothetical protein